MNRVWRPAGLIVTYLLLVLLAVVTLVPLVFTLFASFKPLNEILEGGGHLLPQHWTAQNYLRAWRIGGFGRYFLNSALVAAGVVVLDLIGSSMLGFLLARRMVPLRRGIEVLMSAMLFIGAGTATLYPRFAIAQWLHIDNLVGVALIEVSGLSVVHVFLVKAFCESLPPDIEEAARIDGCGLFRTFWRVTFPLSRPILTSTAILAFQAAWNNFQIPYVFTLGTPSLRTLVVGVFALRSTAEGTEAYDLELAGAMLIILPVALLFFALQRYFLRGMTEGSVKG